jgi:hypothetical protein
MAPETKEKVPRNVCHVIYKSFWGSPDTDTTSEALLYECWYYVQGSITEAAIWSIFRPDASRMRVMTKWPNRQRQKTLSSSPPEKLYLFLSDAWNEEWFTSFCLCSFISEEELKQLSLKKTSTERKFKYQLRKQQLLRLKYMNQSWISLRPLKQ